MAAGGWVVVGVLVLMAVASSGRDATAEGAVHHHVVGDDQGWDASSDHMAAWSIGRSFSVGDNIWFTYSAAQESIAELGSQAEYESCDVTNPIRMYTSGLDRVELSEKGHRYFVSSTPEDCYKGLRLHVQVGEDRQFKPTVGAAGPLPSGAVRVGPASMDLIFASLTLVWFMWFHQYGFKHVNF